MNRKVEIEECRNCKHVKLVHLDDADGSQCNHGWLLNFDGTLANAACHCSGYEPLDNLKYLEMKHAQRFSLFNLWS